MKATKVQAAELRHLAMEEKQSNTDTNFAPGTTLNSFIIMCIFPSAVVQ